MELYEILGRDCFLNALADPALRIRVLDQQPKTLDDVLTTATRMEVYSGESVAEDSNVDRKRVRVISPVRMRFWS